MTLLLTREIKKDELNRKKNVINKRHNERKHLVRKKNKLIGQKPMRENKVKKQ